MTSTRTRIQIDNELTTSEIATYEDIIIKDVMASNEIDNDNDELDGEFVTLPSYVYIVLHYKDTRKILLHKIRTN